MIKKIKLLSTPNKKEFDKIEIFRNIDATLKPYVRYLHYYCNDELISVDFKKVVDYRRNEGEEFKKEQFIHLFFKTYEHLYKRNKITIPNLIHELYLCYSYPKIRYKEHLKSGLKIEKIDFENEKIVIPNDENLLKHYAIHKLIFDLKIISLEDFALFFVILNQNLLDTIVPKLKSILKDYISTFPNNSKEILRFAELIGLTKAELID